MGIDYGNGQTNIDTKTGIRYGVIPANDVGQSWWEDAIPDYGPNDCPECGHHMDDDPRDDECGECGHEIDPDFCWEPLSWFFNDDDYGASQSADDHDVFITKSPYYTRADYCSPCAPGACYLRSAHEDGDDLAYCFGHDWFEDGVAPYTVYRVSDRSIVKP